MITLQPLSQVEFDEYLKYALPHLAEELTRARDITPEEGAKVADASFRAIFPEGRVDSEDQFVLGLEADGRRIGVLHYGVRRDKREPYVYLWDIHLDRAERGKGYGRQVLALLEREVKSLGLRRIRLNVFGHNQTARHLYEQMGYAPESIALVKSLDA